MKKLWVLFLIFLSCAEEKRFDEGAPSQGPEWYKEVVFYQIFPRSFMDSDGDGIGDLKGIIEKLDYLEELGIGGVWLNPIFPSPYKDSGYDVSDYYGINPDYGDMEDFEELLNEAHKRNIKVFLDGVFNHTSDQHEWFKESRKSRDSPKRNWYIWADNPYFFCKDIFVMPGTFGGERWTYDAQTKQYYFHQFLKEQPDLNFWNEEVQNAIIDVVKFWLEKGVDGFRLDVPHSYFEEPWKNLCLHRDETHEFLKKLRKVFDEYDGRAMIGEVWGLPSQINRYLGDGNDELHMIFNFVLTFALYSSVLFGGKEFVEEVLDETFLSFPDGGWQGVVIGNHDIPRSYSIVGEDDEKAKNLAFLQMTLPGTPFVYYGEEIGIKNGEDKDIVVDWRDIARTPMQWNGGENAGFSTKKPWLSPSGNYKIKNYESEKKDDQSLYNFYKKLIRMRNSLPQLRKRGYIPVDTKESGIFAYFRGEGDNWVLVILNLSFFDKMIRIDLRGSPWKEIRGNVLDVFNNEKLPDITDKNFSSYQIYVPRKYRGILLPEK
jgi:alpha-glucosidase